MDKEQFHKKVEILAHKIGSVKKAFETLNSEHEIFLQEIYYRQWKSKNGLTTYIISNCLICGTEIKYLKTKILLRKSKIYRNLLIKLRLKLQI